MLYHMNRSEFLTKDNHYQPCPQSLLDAKEAFIQACKDAGFSLRSEEDPCAFSKDARGIEDKVAEYPTDPRYRPILDARLNLLAAFQEVYHSRSEYQVEGVDFSPVVSLLVALDPTVFKGKNFDRCKMSGSCMIRADLTDTKMWNSDLTNVSLDSAILVKTHFFKCSLRGACLEWSKVDGAQFLNTDCTDIQLSPYLGHIVADGWTFEQATQAEEFPNVVLAKLKEVEDRRRHEEVLKEHEKTRRTVEIVGGAVAGAVLLLAGAAWYSTLDRTSDQREVDSSASLSPIAPTTTPAAPTATASPQPSYRNYSTPVKPAKPIK